MPVSNPPSLSSIISEFGTNGSPNNLYAYRRGGGIISDSSDFSGIGYGTTNSPLSISQFAGLSAVSNWLATMYYPGASVNVGGYGDNVKVDSSGNMYVAGVVGQAQFNGAAMQAIVVAKISTSGGIVWIKLVSGPTFVQNGNYVALNLDSTNNVYLASSVQNMGGDIGFFACKLSSVGDMIWTKFMTLGSYQDIFQNACIDNSGNLYLVGITQEGAPSGYLRAYDTISIKIDTNGNVVWATTHRTNDENFFTSCWTDGTYLYCTGVYNYYGGIQLMKIYAASGGLVTNWYYVNNRSGYGCGITGDNLGNLYLQGNCSDPSYYYPLIMKVNASTGAVYWQKWFEAYGGGPVQTSLKYDPTSGYLYTNPDGTGAIICLNSSNGSIVWQRGISNGSKASMDVNSNTLAINSGFYSTQQYAFSTGVWRIGRVPTNGTKTGTYNTTPSGFSVDWGATSIANHTIANGDATLRGGGGTYLSRTVYTSSTDITSVGASTSTFEKAVI